MLLTLFRCRYCRQIFFAAVSADDILRRRFFATMLPRYAADADATAMLIFRAAIMPCR